MKTILFTLVFSVIASAAPSRLEKFFDEEWKNDMAESPESATANGVPGYDDKWTDLSFEAIKRRNARLDTAMKKLKSLPHDDLNWDLYKYELEIGMEGRKYPSELLPVNQLGGVQSDAPQVLAMMPTDTERDYGNIVARLRALPVLVEQTTLLMQEGIKRKIVPPRIALRDVPDQVLSQIPEDFTKSPLYRPFEKMPDAISKEKQAEIRAVVKNLMSERVVPAFKKFHEFLVKTYLPACRETVGISEVPNGTAWYEYLARRNTTLRKSPKEIHEIGLSEVKRIRAEMDKVIESTGFKGSFDDFKKFLRTDERFFFKDADELLRTYRDIAKRIDPGLIKLFGKLPRLPYGVKAVPNYIEKSQPTAYYEPGAGRVGRAGFFYANTYDLKTRPKWEMEALTSHEAVPGHHLQIAIAQELENVPEFRRFGGYTAYVEGWGLYAEGLGQEIGLYSDPYSKFGQLTYEMWRAIRLVVDTGIHSMGWSRDKAIEFFKENSAKTEHDITVEIDRYITWPGQALGYKMGQLRFRALRDEAKAALGDKFDIRRFHDAVLGNGALPLEVLDARMKKWLAAEKKR